MSKITDRVTALAEPIVADLGCEIWDVEYVREAGTWYLRLYIDKEGGVNINDCEAVSRAMDPVLDEEDPIPDSYVFEVSSAGCERELKTPEHFEKMKGEEVEVRLYKAVDGKKTFVGQLESYDGGDVSIRTDTETIRFDKKDIAQVRLHITI